MQVIKIMYAKNQKNQPVPRKSEILTKKVKHGYFETAMLPWKQLKFRIFISLRNIQNLKHCMAKSHFHKYHLQELILMWNL